MNFHLVCRGVCSKIGSVVIRTYLPRERSLQAGSSVKQTNTNLGHCRSVSEEYLLPASACVQQPCPRIHNVHRDGSRECHTLRKTARMKPPPGLQPGCSPDALASLRNELIRSSGKSVPCCFKERQEHTRQARLDKRRRGSGSIRERQTPTFCPRHFSFPPQASQTKATKSEATDARRKHFAKGPEALAAGPYESCVE